MLGTIEEIVDNSITIALGIDINTQPNLVNTHVVFVDNSPRKVVAEIVNVNKTKINANIVGEIQNGIFTPGSSKKPSFQSNVRLIQKDELELIIGKQELEPGYTNFGYSNAYDGYKINVKINDFFSSHFGIIGNTGSGKSCTVASLFQKLFYSNNGAVPKNSALFFFGRQSFLYFF